MLSDENAMGAMLGARRRGELLGDLGVHEGGAADGKPWRGGPGPRRGARGVSQGLP
jgi:hypothetical protein